MFDNKKVKKKVFTYKRIQLEYSTKILNINGTIYRTS